MTTPIIRMLGMQEYEPTWHRMQQENLARTSATADEIWLLQHPPVFTLGLNGKPEHVLAAGDIPVVKIDRGGQVTYHGPGQLVVYPQINLRAMKLGVRALVMALEQSVIDTLADYGIAANGDRDAPGVYVSGAKIAALGLRIRHGSSYHGLAFNVAMDMEPFNRINPCGYENLAVTQVVAQGGPDSVAQVANDLTPHLLRNLGYTDSVAA